MSVKSVNQVNPPPVGAISLSAGRQSDSVM